MSDVNINPVASSDLDIMEGSVYNLQSKFQKLLKLKQGENPWIVGHTDYDHHLIHMMSEIGELLQADKRWKPEYMGEPDDDEKRFELADIFLEWCNLCIYSGYDAKQMFTTILEKIEINTQRLRNL